MKFLVDESISPKVVRVLKELGYNAYRPREFNLIGAPDAKIAEFALQHNMVIITIDSLFAYKYYFFYKRKLGFVLLRLENPITENIINALKAFLDSVEFGEISKSLSIVKESEFQIIE